MSALLEAAARVGATLTRQAYWSGERCSWVGHPVSEAEPGAPPSLEPLGAALYDGTAGVGLFLADLAAATGEPEARRAARGAFRHAFSRLAALPPSQRWSLFGGALGVGWAAARAGTALEDEALRGEGLALVRRIAGEPSPEGAPLDVIAGAAGGVLALLALDRLEAEPSFRAAAVLLAERIAAGAVKEAGTWSWPTVVASGADMGPRPLTGFAHGAAGMGTALLEVAAHTGRSDLRQGAEAAFRYEDRWFDARRDNWADLRATGQVGGEPSYMLAFCHGAPGCGLGRLRALELHAHHPTMRERAEAALRATLEQLDHDQADADIEGEADVTPCHGIGGLTEVLLWGARVLDRPELGARAVAIWERLAARHGAAASWPSGLPTRNRTPALLVGLSGAGHGLLRVAGAAPSVLLPT